MEANFWVGSVKSLGNPFNIYIVGEYIMEDPESVMIRNVIRILESPTQQGIGLNFLTDNFFTTDNEVKIEKSNILMYRIFNPETDSQMIKQIKEYLTKTRMKRMGFVDAETGVPLNENFKK